MRSLLAFVAGAVMTVSGLVFTDTGHGTETQSKPNFSAAGNVAIVKEDRENVIAKVSKFDVLAGEPDIFDEVLGKKVPGFTHMLYVAWCETRQNWKNSGNYAGAFGFMHHSPKVYKDYSAKRSTWLQWGGWQFAKRPQDATSKEQALIWIRTYTTGWTRPNGVFKPPTRPMKSLCHDDTPFGLHTYTGQPWPVPDDWEIGDEPITPWRDK